MRASWLTGTKRWYQGQKETPATLPAWWSGPALVTQQARWKNGLTGNLSRERLEGASAGRRGETTGRRYCDTFMNTAGLYWNTLRPGKVSWLATQKLWTLCMRLITMRYKLKDSEHMCCTLLCRLCWTLTVLFLWMVSSKVCIVNRSCYYWQICHHFSSIWNLN